MARCIINITFFFCLLIMLMTSQAQARRLCGRRLTDTVINLCKEKLHQPTEEQLKKVYRSHGTGIASHCCKHRCSLEYIMSYCDHKDEIKDSASSEGEKVRMQD